MGLIKSVQDGRLATLEAEHLVGRSPRSALQLDGTFISSQHAVLRWTSDHWEVKDLGSRNGTVLDGVTLKAGQGAALVKGARIRFGDPAEEWELVDDSPPRAAVVPLDGDDPPLVLDGSLLGIPSPDDPQATIYVGADGQWRLERPDAPIVTLADQQTFEVAGRSWRFSCPELVAPTSATDGQVGIDEIALHFRVSRDEEHVELEVVRGGARETLGSRGHNYLLLTLARARLEDGRRGLPDTSCGWMDQEQLLTGLGTSAVQFNVDIFRIRKQFARVGLVDGAAVIERRPRAKQVRLGVGRLTVTTL